MLDSPRAPFDDADADIVFRSSDGVTFNLYKNIIAKASPVMCDMFALPEYASAELGKPVQLTENACVLEHLFRFCYPLKVPMLDTVDDMRAVLDAARKYDMAAIIANMQAVLQHHLPRDAPRIFALAYMHEVADVVRQAAVLLLDGSQPYLPVPPPPEFNVLPASVICAVHEYRQRCIAAARAVLNDNGWLVPENTPHRQTGWVWLDCIPSSSDDSCPMDSYKRDWPVQYYVHRWWRLYLDTLDAALSLHPSGDVVTSFLATSESEKVLAPVKSCRNCIGKAYPDLIRYNLMLARRIDEAVKTITLELPFAS